MLNKNYEILCKLNLTQNNITFNDVIKAASHQLKNVATKIIISYIESEHKFEFGTDYWGRK